MLEKASEMRESNPFLRSYEVGNNGTSVEIIGEPRSVHTKYDAEGTDSIFVDVALKAAPMNVTKMIAIGLTKEEADQRFKTQKRVWRINGTSLNHLIDKFGATEAEWVSKPVDLEVHEMLVAGSLKQVIFAKGSWKLA